MRTSELERVELLRTLLGVNGGRHAGATHGGSSRVVLGIGDDAAVLTPGAEALIWTVDAAVEGVHFRRTLLGWEDLGFRATMAAASDVAAMTGRPIAILAALTLPDDVDDAALAGIARGQRDAADRLAAPVVGGNLSRGSLLSITTTVLGESAEPCGRSGGRAGDALWLAGPVGLAAAGLALLEREEHSGARSWAGAEAAAVEAWKRPTAQVTAGAQARSLANAAIDVSDGLARDLTQLARASGLCAVLDPLTLVGDDLRSAAAALGRDPLELALYGGEDYALVVAAPPSARMPAFTRIGGLERRLAWATSDAGSQEPAHVGLVASSGGVTAVRARGYDHFAQ